MENMHYAAHMCEPTFRAGNEPVSIISFSKLRCLNSCVLTVTFQLVAHGPAKTARMTSGYLDRREAATSTVLAITRYLMRRALAGIAHRAERLCERSHKLRDLPDSHFPARQMVRNPPNHKKWLFHAFSMVTFESHPA